MKMVFVCRGSQHESDLHGYAPGGLWSVGNEGSNMCRRRGYGSEEPSARCGMSISSTSESSQ